MAKRNFTNFQATSICVAVLTALIMAIPITVHAEAMTMSPHKIVLNAQGQFEDVQAVISMPLAAGYTLADYQVTLMFNSIPVSDAFDFRYCYADANFLASFDRAGIQSNPEVIAMANTTVTAVVEGWFTAVASDGSSYTKAFSCSDAVEIVDPKKK